ncbi:MAG: radical SAM family heme chaperone HemW [Oscillospiraceae bacterium]|nr:radical SAM family heme chaperone HemW [Oscillospiraceae bacterium]
MPFGVYIHIPYCLSKCHYCDFYSMGHSKSVPHSYIAALLDQISYHAPLQKADTVYFGGGTPSLLQPDQVRQLLQALPVKADAEITLEANPETVTADSLKGYRLAGVNRISFGVQTALNSSLHTLGRPHTAEQAKTALFMTKTAGFTNISGDIMLALPHYSCAEFDATMALLVEGGVTHISSYLLKIEEGTAFGIHPPSALPTEEQASDFYLYMVAQLKKAGYAQYEISNFAHPGFESRHNLLYWNCEDYLGLGPAAHSCIKGKRFFYPPNLQNFLAGLSRPVADGDCTAEDYIMLQLRLTKGLNLTTLQQKYGLQFTPKQQAFIQRLTKEGYAMLSNNILTLTPKGMLVQNTILCQLL